MKSFRAIAIASSLCLGAAAPSLLAGPLSPPAGPITSTNKPLAEIEPRVAINAATTPGSGLAVHEITQNGSYYLSGDVSVPAGRIGLRVTATNVTIDMNGFRISGEPGSGDGINTPLVAGGSTLTIRNGTLQAVANGASVYAQTLLVQNVNAIDCTADGLHLSGGAIRLDRCGSYRCTGDGLEIGGDAALTACVAEFCTGRSFNSTGNLTASDCSVTGYGGSPAGFYASALNVANCLVTGCTDGFSAGSSITASNCTVKFGQTGFFVRGPNGQATMSNCMATSCSIAGFALINTRNATVSQCTAEGGGIGFNTGVGSKLQGCVAANNLSVGFAAGAPCQIVDCTARANTLQGISTGDGAMIDRCLVAGNTTTGIIVGARSVVTNCNVSGNSINGIHAASSDATIDGNTVTGNSFGIRVDGGCIVTRNKASGNSVNFLFNTTNGANTTGAIVTTPAGMIDASAWANFEF